MEGDGWDDTSSSACEIDSSGGVETDTEREGGREGEREREYMAARIEENEHIRGEHVFFFLGFITLLPTYIHTNAIYLAFRCCYCLLLATFIHSFIQSKGVSQALNRLFLFLST